MEKDKAWEFKTAEKTEVDLEQEPVFRIETLGNMSLELSPAFQLQFLFSLNTKMHSLCLQCIHIHFYTTNI